jgi:multisubunit Na+/H+ antiporter MnhC subunit
MNLKETRESCQIFFNERSVCNTADIYYLGNDGYAVYMFQFAEIVRPYHVKFDPLNNREIRKTNGRITVEMSEPVYISQHEAFVELQSNANFLKIPMRAPKVTIEGKTRLVIDPGQLGSELMWNTQYTMTIPSGAVSDMAGNTWLGLDGTAYLFQTPPKDEVKTAKEQSVPIDLALILGALVLGMVLVCGCLALYIRVRRHANTVQKIQDEELARQARGERPALRVSNTVAWGWSPKGAPKKAISLDQELKKQDEEAKRLSQKKRKSQDRADADPNQKNGGPR